MAIQILLYPIRRPGQVGQYSDPIDVTEACGENVPTLRQRLDRDGWSYGAAVVEDINIPLHSPRGVYFREHPNSVFVHGGRENSKVEIYFNNSLFFTGFLNDRRSKDDTVGKRATLHFTGRLGLLKKTGIPIGLFTPGESYVESLAKCFSPNEAVRRELGVVNINKLDDFSNTPFIIRSSGTLRRQNDILRAMSSLLSVVDGGAIETPTGVNVVRREAQGNTKIVIDDDLLLHRGEITVAQTRLVTLLIITLGSSLSASFNITRSLPTIAQVYGESPIRTLDCRWLSTQLNPTAGFNEGVDISNYLFTRFRNPQQDFDVTLKGIHQINLLDKVELAVNPRIENGEARRLDSGVVLDGSFRFPTVSETGVYGTGYIVSKVIDLYRQTTRVVVRFGAGAA